MNKTKDVVLTLPRKLSQLSEQETTKWYVLQLLDTSLDWRTALEGAKLCIDGSMPALEAPNAEKKLGLIVDSVAAPPHMLVLRTHSDGSNKVLPAGRVSACVKIGKTLPKNTDFGQGDCLKLNPTVCEDSMDSAPLAYWRLGPKIPEDDILQTLTFECTSSTLKDLVGELRGSFSVAPKMQLIGAPKKMTGATYLLGGVAEGKKKMELFEAEVYWVERDGEFNRSKEKELAQEVEDRKALDFKTQRGDAINLAGAAKKRRQEASKAQRIVDETKVADIENCMNELSERAGGFEDMATIKENDQLKLKENLLPAFDKSATESKEIYAKGLEIMLPAKMLLVEKSLKDDKMKDLLLQSDKIESTSRQELLDVFKTSFSVVVARARAKAMPAVQGFAEQRADDADLSTRRFKALHLLMMMYKNVKKQKGYKLAELQTQLGLARGSLSDHMYKYYLTVSPIDRQKRTVFRKKLACHIVILALDLSWGYKLDFQPCVEELGMTIDEMQENVRYCGCECNRGSTSDENVSKGSSRITLMTELKAPLTFQAPKGAGRGKRKRG